MVNQPSGQPVEVAGFGRPVPECRKVAGRTSGPPVTRPVVLISPHRAIPDIGSSPLIARRASRPLQRAQNAVGPGGPGLNADARALLDASLRALEN